jgi:hypothetical protein
MRGKKLYYDAVFTGLIEVKDPRPAEDPHMVLVTVAKSHKGYKAGEELEVFRMHVVNKAGCRDGFIRVITADLPCFAGEEQ